MVDKYDRLVEDAVKLPGGQAGPNTSESCIWNPFELWSAYHGRPLAEENIIKDLTGKVNTLLGDCVIEGI